MLILSVHYINAFFEISNHVWTGKKKKKKKEEREWLRINSGSVDRRQISPKISRKERRVGIFPKSILRNKKTFAEYRHPPARRIYIHE